MTAPRHTPTWKITTSPRPTDQILHHAARLAEEMELTLSPRSGSSMKRLAHRFPGAGWLVTGPGESLTCLTPEGQRMRWHLGLAKSRIAAANKGRPDYLLQSLQPAPGERYFDATLGMAHDALLVASRGASIVAMELDPIVHAITTSGLKALSQAGDALSAAASRVETRTGDHTDFLRHCETDSFDGVFFSPMFMAPNFRANDLEGLREIAHADWLHPDALSEARRISRKVVLKLERHRHPPLPEPTQWFGSPRRRLRYALYLR